MQIDELKHHKFNIVNSRYIKKNFQELFDFLNITYPNLKSVSEKLYWWQNNIKEQPTCKVCGSPTTFEGYNKGYRKYCSYICMNNDKEKQEKTKQTCLKKYGTENPRQNEIVKEKSKQTCLERYGVDNPAKSQIIKEKIELVNLAKYGAKYSFQSEIVKERIRKTLLDRYGVDHPMKCPAISQLATLHKKETIIDEHNNVLGYTEGGDWICKCPHPECNKCQEKTFAIKASHLYDRLRGNTEPCTKLQPIQAMYSSLELWIRSILNEHHIKYESNVRTLLDGKELDVYIPSKHIAIECNGIYWHSTTIKSSQYHKDKFKNCLKNNIQLLTFWEDQIINKPAIVESVLLSKLGIYERRIGARKCKAREITNKESRRFLQFNHIQGPTNAKICIGLFYNDKLEGVMTFNGRTKLSGSKTINPDEWELTRFCTSLNTQIIGAADKLLSYFIKHYNPHKIISFSSNDISVGELYKKLGFTTDGHISNAYWYIDDKTLQRHHRSTFTKSAIKRLGIDIEGKTETELMSELPYRKIYDSGHIRWEKLI